MISTRDECTRKRGLDNSNLSRYAAGLAPEQHFLRPSTSLDQEECLQTFAGFLQTGDIKNHRNLVGIPTTWAFELKQSDPISRAHETKFYGRRLIQKFNSTRVVQTHVRYLVRTIRPVTRMPSGTGTSEAP